MRFAGMWILGLSCVLVGGCGKSDKEKLLESYQEADKRRHQAEKEMAEYREKRNELSKQYQAGKIGSFNPSYPEFKSLTIDQQAFLTKNMPSVLLNPLFSITISGRELPALDAKLVSLIQKDLEASAERSSAKDYLRLRKYIEYDRKPTEVDTSLSYEESEKQEQLAAKKFAETFEPHQ